MASTYLSKTLGTSTNTYKGTVSLWFKKSQESSDQVIYGNYTSGTQRGKLVLASDDKLMYYQNDGGSVTFQLETSRLFRDFSAWYHIVLSVDTTQSTASDRVKLYVNGIQETAFDTSTYPSQNTVFYLNANSVTNYIGQEGNSSDYWDGSMTHINVIDGTAYDADDFGETDSTSGIWKPKTAPSVTYGTNGFFLKFENSGAMGTDSSGNSNTFTVSGTLTQNVDTASNNFATMNVLSPVASGYTIANGNLSITANTGDAWRSMYGTLGNKTGKYYWEVKMVGMNNTDGTASCQMHGIADLENMLNTNGEAGDGANGYVWRNHGGYKTGGVGQTGTYGTYVPNDILMFAMDLDNSKLYFGKNGTWEASGNPESGATGTGALSITAGQTYTAVFETKYTADNIAINFGQGYFGTTQVASAGTAPSEGGIFEYDCPSGYQALCTKGINSF